MDLKSQLLQHQQFFLENNVFYQKDLGRSYPFAQYYIALREKEQRVYSDDVLKELPQISKEHIHHKEWAIRRNSLEKLIYYLRKKKNVHSILELGCGNGWVSHHLASLPKTEVMAVDVNEHELKQGARVFEGDKNLSFLYADIFKAQLPVQFDVIVLAGAIQYFPDFKKLIDRLLESLKAGGEIHIVDSPFYGDEDVKPAQSRSENYFQNAKAEAMKEFYHHHSWNSLKDFNSKIKSKPFGVLHQLEKTFLYKSPFPWVIIIK